MPFLLALLIGLPLAEIAVLIAVGGEIGLWATLALLVLAGLAGSLLIRASGLAVLWQARAAAQMGRSPAGALLAGAFSVLAGILLIIPGFLTDILALLLLVPVVQAALVRGVPRRRRAAAGARPVIDGDYTELRPGAPPRAGSPWSSSLPPR